LNGWNIFRALRVPRLFNYSINLEGWSPLKEKGDYSQVGEGTGFDDIIGPFGIFPLGRNGPLEFFKGALIGSQGPSSSFGQA